MLIRIVSASHNRFSFDAGVAPLETADDDKRNGGSAVSRKKKKKEEDEEEGGEEGNKKEKSVLQAKLTNLAKQIGYAGKSAAVWGGGCPRDIGDETCVLSGSAIAVLTILTLIIRHCVTEFAIHGRAFDVGKDIQYFVRAVIVGITVLVIAVPEGLPLAVTLSLAYSVKVSGCQFWRRLG